MTIRLSRRRFLTAASTVALAATVPACGGGSGSTSASAGPYRVYVSTDMSGPTKSFSQPIGTGLKIAAERINKAGGILGRQVEVEEVDDQNNPTKAVSLLQERLSADEQPDLVYPGTSSAVALSLLPVLTRSKILGIGGASAEALNDPAKFPYYFAVIPSGRTYAATEADAAKQAGWRKVAILYSNDATGQNALRFNQEAMQRNGIELVSAAYETGALDMTPQLQQLQAQNPDALIVNGYGTAALYGFRGRAQLGWTLPTFGDQLASAFPLAQNLKPQELVNVKLVLSAMSVVGGDQSPELAQLGEEIKAAGQGEMLANSGYAIFLTGYDSLQVAKAAVEQAGATEIEDVAAALKELRKPEGTPSWLADGASGEGVQYRYTDTEHFPSYGARGLVMVEPGTYNADGLYQPGARPQ